MWLVEDQACAHSKETQFVPLDHWWVIQRSCRVLSYLVESRISLPAASQHTVWLPNDTVGREDISLLAAPTCDTDLMEVLTMFSDISRRVHSAEIGGLLPSQLFAFIESSFCGLMFTHLYFEKGWKATWKGHREHKLGARALHVSPSAFKVTTNHLIQVSGMNCHFVFSPSEVSHSNVSLGLSFSVSGHICNMKFTVKLSPIACVHSCMRIFGLRLYDTLDSPEVPHIRKCRIWSKLKAVRFLLSFHNRYEINMLKIPHFSNLSKWWFF